MKKKGIFKSKTEMIVTIILFCVFMWGFIYFGTKDYQKNEISDSEKFVSEHKEANSDNVFTYINSSDAYTYIHNDDVLLFIGIRNSDWVSYYGNVLNDVAKELGIESIYYYDITDDRASGNGAYESIVHYLKDYVTYLDDGKANLYGPTLLIKKDGIITYFDDDTAFMQGLITAGDYWTNYQINLKKTTLKVALEDYLGKDNNGEI